MPTVAESGLQMNGVLISGDSHRLASTDSWTDDLPACLQTGVGTQSNQLYRRNGSRQEFHSCEDKSFHFSLKDNYFYGLFDGHEGPNAANFMAQHLPAEFLLGQLSEGETDQQIHNLFMNAFNSVEREFFKSIDGYLAEKTSLELQILGMNEVEAIQTYPEIIERLKTVTAEVSSGTAAVVALIHSNRLHVANVGDSKAILCKTDSFGNYTAKELSTVHDLHNTDELSRLAQLGVEIDYIKERQKIGNISITRCIGNYLVKGAYKEFTDLCCARDEPIIAIPAISSVPIDESCQFLVLASGSIFRTLEDATNTDSRQVNIEVIRMVAEEFKTQSTLTGVAQAVVNKICRIHQDRYLASMNDPNLPQSFKEIEDLTLMVRNFRHPLVKGLSSPNSRSPSVSSIQRNFNDQLRISINEEDEPEIPRNRSFSKTLITAPSVVSTVTEEHQNSTFENTETTTNTTNSTDFEDRRFNSQKADPLDLDAEGRIAAYVQFDEFLKSIESAKLRGEDIGFQID